MRDPPGCSVNTPVVALKNPARFSLIWLVAPSPGFDEWHSPHPTPLKIGPIPAAVSSGPVNSSTAVSKLHSSSGIAGESAVSVANAAWLAQNSSANPLDPPSKPVTASVCAWTSPALSTNIDATVHTATGPNSFNLFI